MKTTTLWAGAALAAGLALSTGAQAVTNFVADGDFSNPSGGGSYVTYGVGAMGPWNVTTGSVDLIGGYWQSPTAGGGSIDLDGNSPGSLSQSLALAAGSYTLSFYLSGNPDGGIPTKTVNVSVGNLNQTFTYVTGANTHANMMYVLETVSFTTAGPTTLSFTSGDAGGPFGAAIGGVSVVSAVPEPAAWTMMLVGFGAIGFAARRRARRVCVAAA